MWFNKSVVIINTMLKILDIIGLRYIYIYIYIYIKFGFRICIFTIFKCTKMDQSGPKWIKVDTNGSNKQKWTEWEQGGSNKTEVD